MNFNTEVKSYKTKKQAVLSCENWQIFENTYDPIISQHDFDLLQELRKNKRGLRKANTKLSLFRELFSVRTVALNYTYKMVKKIKRGG